jgi:hypothetical protein
MSGGGRYQSVTLKVGPAESTKIGAGLHMWRVAIRLAAGLALGATLGWWAGLLHRPASVS